MVGETDPELDDNKKQSSSHLSDAYHHVCRDHKERGNGKETEREWERERNGKKKKEKKT